MYKNLDTILKNEGITRREFGLILGISEKSVDNKINGKTEFTYPEFKKTALLLRKYSTDYMFEEQ